MHFSEDQAHDSTGDVAFALHRVGAVAVVEVRGELDAHGVDAFAAAVGAALHQARGVVLDLSGTTFVDCRSLARMLALQSQAQRHDVRLRCAEARPVVRLLFETLDVSDLLGSTRTVDEEVLDLQTALQTADPAESR